MNHPLDAADDLHAREVPFPGEKGRSWTIRFRPGGLAHIIDKHVRSADEPWQDVLGSQVRDTLRTLAGRNRRDEDLRPLRSALLDQAWHSCKRPMGVRYQEAEIGDSEGSGVSCWVLVCPSGLQIVVRESADGRYRIHTAYFCRSAARLPRHNAHNRWRRAADELVRCYCFHDGGRAHFSREQPPREVDDRESGRTVLRSRVDFVTHAKWSFEAEGERFRHTYRLPEWEAANKMYGAGSGVPAAPPRRAPLATGSRSTS